MRKKKIVLDESKLSLWGILSHRVPWLFLGLVGGIGVTFIVSTFEELLSKNIHLAFFVPVIVYLADSFGTQSEVLYIRAVNALDVHMGKYLAKEMIAGGATGLVFGLLLWSVAVLWLNDFAVALAVGVAMVVNMILAPLVTLSVSVTLQNVSEDPAFGAGPIATILQDLVSVSVYLVVAMMIFKTI